MQGKRLGFSGWSADGSLSMAGHLWDIFFGFPEPGPATGWLCGLKLGEDEFAYVFCCCYQE